MIASFLVVTALATVQPASAPPDLAPSRRAVQATVITRDLDLRSDEGRRRFHARVEWAARMACGPFPRELTLTADVTRCIRQVRADGTRQLAALNGQAPVSAKP